MCQKGTGKDGIGEARHRCNRCTVGWGRAPAPSTEGPWAPAEPPGPGSPGLRTLREGGPGQAMQCERTPGEGPTAPAAPEPQPQQWRGHQWG